jgi:hypothetical protein
MQSIVGPSALAGTRFRAIPSGPRRWHRLGAACTLDTVRVSDAAEIVAIDVLEAAQVAGEPVTVAFVKRRCRRAARPAP